jgi:hypothetical protein
LRREQTFTSKLVPDRDAPSTSNDSNANASTHTSTNATPVLSGTPTMFHLHPGSREENAAAPVVAQLMGSTNNGALVIIGIAYDS